MKFSQFLIPTLKETPKDAVLQSHKLLLRAGFMQHVSSGIYNLLPLGKLVQDRIKAVIKEELDKAGCGEVQLGFVTPASLWEKSGRLSKYGKELLVFQDRKDNDFVLGPTHEEMMVQMVKDSVSSYKQLPLNLYQINTKFRDEIRPRFGLMRGREFLMKDGYSFHADKEDMKREFEHMQKVYSRIFTRLGLDYRIVEADSGAIGGSGSKEFMVLADSGEDTVVVCDKCDYGANVEAAVAMPAAKPEDGMEANFAKFHTPDTTTIEAVSTFFKVDPYYAVKTVVKKAVYEEGEALVAFALRGSEELSETKAANAAGALELLEADRQELEEAGLVAGYMGPIDMQIPVYVDEDLQEEACCIVGANEKDYHYVGAGFDQFACKDTADLKEVKEGQVCAKCQKGHLHYKKGIEVGHIFQLETAYSKPLEATFLDENGKARPFEMGTYGIGVSRLIAAVIEQNHDDKGCKWTHATAPFSVNVIVANAKKQEQLTLGTQIYDTLRENGIDTILDDRKDRFGAKMKDFELIGFPYGVIIGKRAQEGIVEVVNRTNLDKIEVPVEEILNHLGV
ncbi:MAG: proline--tRNA ligase [Campylobacterota bacterium]